MASWIVFFLIQALLETSCFALNTSDTIVNEFILEYFQYYQIKAATIFSCQYKGVYLDILIVSLLLKLLWLNCFLEIFGKIHIFLLIGIYLKKIEQIDALNQSRIPNTIFCIFTAIDNTFLIFNEKISSECTTFRWSSILINLSHQALTLSIDFSYNTRKLLQN